MSPIDNGRVVFKAIPEGYPEPGKHLIYDETETIDLDSVQLDGGVLAKTLYLSVEPYMRSRMRAADVPSYLPAFPLGEPIVSSGIALVLRSDSPRFKAGDHISGIFPHKQYFVIDHDNLTTPVLEGAPVLSLDNPNGLKWSDFLGVLGIPGFTAYFAWKEYSRSKTGDIVFVSSGASSVGSLVIQLAKADGCKVIASAGSDDKINFMKECGADVAFNYKTSDTNEVLKKEGPIDIYWDNVGGSTLDAALENAQKYARFIACGAISSYNNPKGTPVYKMDKVFAKCITIYGFLVLDLAPKWIGSFIQEIHPKVASGEIKHREEVFEGLKSVPDAMLAVQSGKNKAKVVVHVGNE